MLVLLLLNALLHKFSLCNSGSPGISSTQKYVFSQAGCLGFCSIIWFVVPRLITNITVCTVLLLIGPPVCLCAGRHSKPSYDSIYVWLYVVTT